MEAYTLTDKIMQYLNEDPHQFDFIAVNYANTDMVGHTGNFESAKRSSYNFV